MVNGIGSGGLNILRNLTKTQNSLQDRLNQLSSGRRITPRTDASGVAIASGLSSQQRSLSAVNRGINFSQGALNTASGALSSTRDNLQRLREIAVQASNGTLGESDRANLQAEFEQVQSNIDDIASNTDFNGKNLLDGSFSESVQTGTQAGQSQDISVGGVSSADLGVADEGVATQESAQDALAAIDSALEQVAAEEASIGATQNALEFRQNANAIQKENLAAAESQIADTDLAETLSGLQKDKFLQEAQISVLRAQQQTESDKSKQLFGGLINRKA